MPIVPDTAHDWGRLQPEVLDDGLTGGELVFALAHLNFDRDELCTLKIDRGVRDFLVDTIRHRCHSR
jgi:hypothetical protein